MEALLDSTIATRVVLGFEVRLDALGARLPPSWNASPVPAGPAAGANLIALFNEALLNQDGDGSTAPDAAGPYVGFVIPAVRQTTGERASFNFKILAAHPQAIPGKYKTSGPATIRQERTLSGVDLDAVVTESVEVTAAGGGTVTLRLRYSRGLPARVASESRVRSVADPSILRLYRTDELLDVVKSAAQGVDRVTSCEFHVTVPDLADLFDGRERMMSITTSPWYLRRVFGPAGVPR